MIISTHRDSFRISTINASEEGEKQQQQLLCVRILRKVKYYVLMWRVYVYVSVYGENKPKEEN
jgi:hypothetical protein